MKISSENKKMLLRLLISVVVICFFIGAIFLILKVTGVTKLTQEQLQSYIKSSGAIAPLIYILISFLQVTFVPIPGAITIVAGSYVFGAFLSFIYSYIGMLLGATFAFFLGKSLGRPFVNWVVGNEQKVDEWILKLKGKQNVILFFMFLLPFFPDDILCSIAGLLPITYLGFFVMQVVTRASSIGFTILFMSGEFIPYEGWGLFALGGIAIVCIVAFVLSIKYSEKINDFFVEKVNLIFGKRNNKDKFKDEQQDKKQRKRIF